MASNLEHLTGKPLPGCKKGLSKWDCPYNPLLGCDCGIHKPHEPVPQSWEDPKTETEYRRKLNGK